MYRDAATLSVPCVTGTKSLHAIPPADVVESLPMRTLIPTVLPAGCCVIHCAVRQLTTDFASKMRESKVPDKAYGGASVTWKLLIASAPIPTLKSLAAIIIGAGTTTSCVTRSWPSTQNATLFAFQSM